MQNPQNFDKKNQAIEFKAISVTQLIIVFRTMTRQASDNDAKNYRSDLKKMYSDF